MRISAYNSRRRSLEERVKNHYHYTDDMFIHYYCKRCKEHARSFIYCHHGNHFFEGAELLTPEEREFILNDEADKRKRQRSAKYREIWNSFSGFIKGKYLIKFMDGKYDDALWIPIVISGILGFIIYILTLCRYDKLVKVAEHLPEYLVFLYFVTVLVSGIALPLSFFFWDDSTLPKERIKHFVYVFLFIVLLCYILLNFSATFLIETIWA